MISTTLAPVRLAPEWAAGTGRAYFIRPGTLDERDLFEATLAGPPFMAGEVNPFLKLEHLRGAIAGLPMEDDARALLMGYLNTLLAGDDLAPAEAALLDQFEVEAFRMWPPLLTLGQQAARREAVLPTLALRWFLTGWEGVEAPFETGPDGRPTDATIRAIPEFEAKWLGRRAFHMLSVGPAEKNVSSPGHGSTPAPAISSAASGPRTAARAGKSKGTSGRKTPA